MSTEMKRRVLLFVGLVVLFYFVLYGSFLFKGNPDKSDGQQCDEKMEHALLDASDNQIRNQLGPLVIDYDWEYNTGCSSKGYFITRGFTVLNGTVHHYASCIGENGKLACVIH